VVPRAGIEPATRGFSSGAEDLTHLGKSAQNIGIKPLEMLGKIYLRATRHSRQSAPNQGPGRSDFKS